MDWDIQTVAQIVMFFVMMYVLYVALVTDVL